MSQERLNRVNEGMRKAGLDALFLSNAKNVQYLTGFRPMMPGEVQSFGDPEGFALVVPGAVHLLCDGRYVAGAKKLNGVTAQLMASPTTARVIADIIKEILGTGSTTIGYECDALLHSDAVGLMDCLSGLRCESAEALMAGLRVVKSAAEIELIRKAQAITSDCFEHICRFIRVGMTERDVALEIDNYLRRNSEGNSFDPIVAFGETGCNPHYLPSPERKLGNGQLVLLDFGAIYQGYCGDMTRMLCMGKADDHQREVYDLVLRGQQRCLDGIKPGATCHELDARCRDFFAEKGCAEQFAHGTGHGVGLAIHEDPRIKKGFETRIEPGMVFSVEPGLYYEGWGGVRIEDLVAVTESGYDNLTTTSKVLRELEI